MTLTRLDKCPFPWFGGKADAAPAVWQALGDVAHYVDPFCGSLAMLLRRPHPCNPALAPRAGASGAAKGGHAMLTTNESLDRLAQRIRLRWKYETPSGCYHTELDIDEVEAAIHGLQRLRKHWSGQ